MRVIWRHSSLSASLFDDNIVRVPVAFAVTTIAKCQRKGGAKEALLVATALLDAYSACIDREHGLKEARAVF